MFSFSFFVCLLVGFCVCVVFFFFFWGGGTTVMFPFLFEEMSVCSYSQSIEILVHLPQKSRCSSEHLPGRVFAVDFVCIDFFLLAAMLSIQPWWKIP